MHLSKAGVMVERNRGIVGLGHGERNRTKLPSSNIFRTRIDQDAAAPVAAISPRHTQLRHVRHIFPNPRAEQNAG